MGIKLEDAQAWQESLLSKHHLVFVFFLGIVKSVSVVEMKSVPVWFYQCPYHLILFSVNGDSKDALLFVWTLALFSVLNIITRSTMFIFQSCCDGVHGGGCGTYGFS